MDASEESYESGHHIKRIQKWRAHKMGMNIFVVGFWKNNLIQK
jgi:hypothetical protein